MLMNIEGNYHGMTEFFRTGGISAKAQTKHAIKTDQRGEQTIYTDAKSTGYSIQSGSHTNTANKYTKMAAYYGNGKCRKRMSRCGWYKRYQQWTLVGFHSFTGNGYIPATFRKGKDTFGQQ